MTTRPLHLALLIFALVATSLASPGSAEANRRRRAAQFIGKLLGNPVQRYEAYRSRLPAREVKRATPYGTVRKGFAAFKMRAVASDFKNRYVLRLEDGAFQGERVTVRRRERRPLLNKVVPAFRLEEHRHDATQYARWDKLVNELYDIALADGHRVDVEYRANYDTDVITPRSKITGYTVTTEVRTEEGEVRASIETQVEATRTTIGFATSTVRIGGDSATFTDNLY